MLTNVQVTPRKARKRAQKIKNKMAGVSPNMSITTLNINGLNIPIKRQKLAE